MLPIILHDAERNLYPKILKLNGNEKKLGTRLYTMMMKAIKKGSSGQDLIRWYNGEKLDAKKIIEELRNGSEDALRVAEDAYWLINDAPNFYLED